MAMIDALGNLAMNLRAVGPQADLKDLMALEMMKRSRPMDLPAITDETGATVAPGLTNLPPEQQIAGRTYQRETAQQAVLQNAIKRFLSDPNADLAMKKQIMGARLGLKPDQSMSEAELALRAQSDPMAKAALDSLQRGRSEVGTKTVLITNGTTTKKITLTEEAPDIPAGWKMVEPPATNIALGVVDAQGNPVIIPNRGTPTPTAVQMPGGTFPKPQYLSDEQASKNAALENVRGALQRMRSTYRPEYVGMLDAPLGLIQDKTGVGVDQRRTVFRADVAAIRNMLLNMRSGAAVTPQEFERLLPELPQPDMSDQAFEAQMNRFEVVLDDIISERAKAFRDAGVVTGPPRAGLSGSPGGGGTGAAPKILKITPVPAP